MVKWIHSLADLHREIRERELLQTFDLGVTVSTVPPVMIVEVARDAVTIELHDTAVDPFDIDAVDAVHPVHVLTSADSG